MPINRSRPARLAPVAATFSLLLIQVAAALAASPGTNPFNSAIVRWILDAGTIESVEGRDALPADYQPTSALYKFCLPPGDSETNTQASGTFDVAADGKMTGTCHAERTTVSGEGTSFVTVKDGTLTGQYDLAAQTVTFHFEGTTNETYIPPPTCEGPNCGPIPYVYGVVIDGPITGGAVVGDHVDGTLRHTSTCSSAPGYCYITSQTATSAFLIQFLPPLPSEAPAPGPTTPGGTSENNFILMLALAGASAAILAAAVLWFRSRQRLTPVPTAAAPHQTTSASAAVAGARPSADPAGAVDDFVDTSAELIAPEADGAGAAETPTAESPPTDDTVTPPLPGQDITPEDAAAVSEVVDPGGALMPRATGAPSDNFDPKADEQAADALNFLEVSAQNAELGLSSGVDAPAPMAPTGADMPPQPPTPGQPGTLNLEGEGWANTPAETPDEFAESWITDAGAVGTPGSARPAPPPAGTPPPAPTPPPAKPTPPTPGEPGALNLEGEGFAGSYADTPDAFVEDWVSNTGAVGTPGSARQPAPPPGATPPPPTPPPAKPPQSPTPGQSGTLNLEGEGWANTRADSPDEFAEGWIGNTGAFGTPEPPAEPKTPEQAIKDEATNIIDAIDPDAPKT